MGCVGSKEDAVRDPATEEDLHFGGVKEKPTTKYAKPKWKSEEPYTPETLKAMRDEFWDTQPHYGGDRVIWDALKAACEAEMATAKLIIESAGVIVASPDMTVCYDERGAKYELPKFVLSDPINVVTAPAH
mmetsp:Transcript_12486/g.26927  ORF Transcript_12486/g.26927 Transcript_12486/m.26927 type:complete len:131 (+) Transcript_12486:219-611(+)|eukprot:CAMPEP_0202893340 /NCGR_PEP_ID=MMETSP1392-20130828/2943_1 /ASSEMBLY_ACC=CAM_ASM_000868 /TAXON_ID=225041 /ORGANISM="Chlamydomonas chlamydogama, Strain SAG 11-48b" /LENGTH=130 /DNA_ID=CAMNT_0049577641 /DNA_START=198 /DNA_END=590 /DNA_ORIENTATION=-